MSESNGSAFPEGAIDEQIKYVWVDEDGREVSPVHAKFRSALSFYAGWHDKAERHRKRFGEDADLTQPHSGVGYSSLSKSGKAPVQLKRVVIRTYIEDLADKQQAIVDAYLEEG